MKDFLKAKFSAVKALQDSAAPDNIEYLPAGEHVAYCTLNDFPVELKVVITEETAKVLQGSLAEVLELFNKGEISRPFVDFDHLGGRAAAFPESIYWEDGVRLKLSWTRAGKEAVENKEYSYFSPEFFVDKETFEVRGVNWPGAIGALCNIPAFQTIEKIAATLNPKGTTTMTEEEKKKMEELETSVKDKDAEIAALKAADAEKDKAASDAKTAAETEKQKAEAARKASIETSVDLLIAAKRVKPEGKDALVNAAMATADGGKALFAAIPDAAPGRAPIQAKQTDDADAKKADGIARAAAGFNKQLKAKE